MGKLVKIIIQGVTSQKAQKELDDIMRCRNDILYFCKKCMILTDVGLKAFEPYPWQAKLLKMLTTTLNKRDLVMAARQTGKTTVVAVFFLWYAMFHHDKNLWIFANKDAMAKEIMQKIREMYANLPKHLRFELKHNSKSWIEFRENHSRIGCSALSDKWIHGRSLDYVWIDEAAFCHEGGMDTKFIACTFPVFSTTNTGMILTSTPHGTANEFYQLWLKSPGNGFRRTKVTWSDVPGRDEDWKKKMIRDNGKLFFDQEFDCKVVRVKVI